MSALLNDTLVAIGTVANALAISRRSAYRIVSEDRLIPSVHVRGSLRIRLSDLNAFIAALGASRVPPDSSGSAVAGPAAPPRRNRT